MTTLHVHRDGATVGTLRAWSFAYAESWLATPGAWAISSSLPLTDRPYEAAARNWFSNLLPEAGARDRVARRLRIDPDDDFALLVALGGECAGALTLDEDPEPAPSTSWSSYRKLSDHAFTELLSVPGSVSAILSSGDARLSLAGAQDKLPVRAEGGALCLPLGTAASTHLLKLPSRDNAALVENEALCLELARQVGLPVVHSELRTVGEHVALLVERYDRQRLAQPRERRPRARSGAVVLPSIVRSHQEDFAQALGYSRRQKYEAEGGPSLAACAELVRRNGAQPALELRELVRWLAFCAVVGNRDNHAKNLARVLDLPSGRWRVAPFYDLVNTTSYRGLSPDLAFRIGDESSANRLSRASWERQAAAMAVSPRLVVREVDSMADRIHERLRHAVSDVAGRIGGDDRLVGFVRAIKKGIRWARSSVA